MPTVGALDDPAARPAPLASTWLFTPTTQVQFDPASAHFTRGVVVVVAFVEAEIVRSTRTSWSSERHGVQRLAGHPFVVDVGASDRHGNGHAASIGQDVALGSELAAIGRIGTGQVPPFGAFTLALSSEDQFQSMPRRSS